MKKALMFCDQNDKQEASWVGRAPRVGWGTVGVPLVEETRPRIPAVHTAV